MITSIQNPNVKAWKKLQKRKYRDQSKCFLIEGSHLIEEALNSNWKLKTLLVREDITIPTWAKTLHAEILEKSIFNHIAQTETPQGIAAVVKMKESKPKSGLNGNILVMDQVQDPGNVGTMIRTADAAGFSKVILGQGSVDVFNEKVIRASQGSIFHIPVVGADLTQEIEMFKRHEYHVLASALIDAVPLYEASIPEKTALIVGNEGAGIRDSILQLADKRITIPIYGKAESLNVSVAAGILMYQIAMKA